MKKLIMLFSVLILTEFFSVSSVDAQVYDFHPAQFNAATDTIIALPGQQTAKYATVINFPASVRVIGAAFLAQISHWPMQGEISVGVVGDLRLFNAPFTNMINIKKITWGNVNEVDTTFVFFTDDVIFEPSPPKEYTFGLAFTNIYDRVNSAKIPLDEDGEPLILALVQEVPEAPKVVLDSVKVHEELKAIDLDFKVTYKKSDKRIFVYEADSTGLIDSHEFDLQTQATSTVQSLEGEKEVLMVSQDDTTKNFFFPLWPLPIDRQFGWVIENRFELRSDTTWVEVKFNLQGDVPDPEPQHPESFLLAQNYPNPFNPQTTIRYGIPEGEAQQVSLKIFNLLGQEIITLVDEVMEPRLYKVVWSGEDYAGRVVASGVYIYNFRAGTFSDTKKMLLRK